MAPGVEIAGGQDLRIHDGRDSVTVPREQIEDFLVDLGEAVCGLADIDVKHYIKLLIRAWRESATDQG